MRHEATYLDLTIMKAMDQNNLLNFPSIVMKYMTVDYGVLIGRYALPYRFLLTMVF